MAYWVKRILLKSGEFVKEDELARDADGGHASRLPLPLAGEVGHPKDVRVRG
jgi:hypothetical protein